MPVPVVLQEPGSSTLRWKAARQGSQTSSQEREDRKMMRKELTQDFDKEVNSLQPDEFIVIGVNAEGKEESCIASVNELVVAKLITLCLSVLLSFVHPGPTCIAAPVKTDMRDVMETQRYAAALNDTG